MSHASKETRDHWMKEEDSANTAPPSRDQDGRANRIVSDPGLVLPISRCEFANNITASIAGSVSIIEIKMPAALRIRDVVAVVTQGSETIKPLERSGNYSNTGTTASEEPSLALNESIEKLMATAREGLYEGELSEKFSGDIESLLERFGDSAVVALAPYVLRVAPCEIVSEMLRCFGNIEDQGTYKSRLWLVIKSLQSSSTWIRDSATLALAVMEDPHAIPYLEAAISNEKNEALKQNMLPVLKHLKSIR